MSDENICARCDCECAIDWPDEPTKYCHGCAHLRVEELEPEVERLREVIHQHVATELKLSAMTVELEEKIARLQAENTEALRYVTSLCRSWFPSIEPLSDLNGVISQLDNGVCGLRAENAELSTTLQQQREIWNMSTPNIRGELEWFKSREQFMRQVKALYGANIDETDVLQAIDELIEWEKANPKPGAGT